MTTINLPNGKIFLAVEQTANDACIRIRFRADPKPPDDLHAAAEGWRKCLDADPCDVFPVSVKLANLLVRFSLGKLSCAPINENMPKPTTVRNLLEYRPSQLLAIKGFGRGTLRELQGHLEKHGLRLKEER